MEENCMTRLMICSDLFLLIRDDTALLLCTDSHFHKSVFHILLFDKGTILHGCMDGCLV